MVSCTICGRAIVLAPPATERAEKFGGRPFDYTRLFTAHADCQIAKRNADTLALMRHLNQKDHHGLQK